MTTRALIQDALKAVDHASQAVAAAFEALSALSLLLTEMAVAGGDAPPTSAQPPLDDARPTYCGRPAGISGADFAVLGGARPSAFEPRLGERASHSLVERFRAARAAVGAAVPGEATHLSASTPYSTTLCVSSDDNKAVTVGQLKAVLDAYPDAMVYVRVCSEDSVAVAEEHPTAVAAATMRFEPSGDPLRPAQPYFHRKSHQWIGLAWDAPPGEPTTAVCIGASMGSDAHVPTASELAKTLAACAVDHSGMPVEVGVWTAQGPHTGALVEVFLKDYDASKRAITLIAKDGVFPWPADALEAANSPETARTIDTAISVASAMALIPTFTNERIAKCVEALVPESWTLPLTRRIDAGILPAHERDDDGTAVRPSVGNPSAALAEQTAADQICVHRCDPTPSTGTPSATRIAAARKDAESTH